MGRWSKIGIGLLVAVVAIAATLWAMNWFAPGGALDRRPKLVDTPPLAPVSRNSMIVTPAVITLTAIRNALESAAPPEITGKAGMPQMAQIPIMPNAEINWSVTRTPLDIVGLPEGLQLSTALRGSLRAVSYTHLTLPTILRV